MSANHTIKPFILINELLLKKKVEGFGHDHL